MELFNCNPAFRAPISTDCFPEIFVSFVADKAALSGLVTASLVLPALLALLVMVLVSLLAFADCAVFWLGTADGVGCDSDFGCDCDCGCDCVPAAEPEALLERVSPVLRTVTLLFSSRITGDEFSIALISEELATEVLSLDLLDSPELFWRIF